MSKTETCVLVVEDNDLDVENLQRCLRRMKIENPVFRAKDGVEGLDRLRGRDPETGMKRPYVVLLDLNMPRMNGIEFLEEIRKDPLALSDTPVFVLTTSDHHRDIQAAHRHNVCGYIVKPMDRTEMMEALGMLNSYWQVCKLPIENRLPC